MAAPSGTQDPDVAAGEVSGPGSAEQADRYNQVKKLLETIPQEFDFFQAVRLLERIFPAHEPVGRFVVPSSEVARFSAHASMVFPASAIQQINWGETGPPAIIVNFMGLTGPQGVLPLYYTQLIIDRIRAKETSMLAFFDIFNHRAISLFYQAWEKYRFAFAYERSKAPRNIGGEREQDPMSHILMHLIGIGTTGLPSRQAVPDHALLFYSGLLSLHPRSSAALRNLLWDYFDVPVEIEQYVGAWYRLDVSTQCRFEKGSTYSEQVGVGVIVGDEIWDQQSGVRIRLGPLSLPQYLDFLPNGTAYQPLKALVRFFGGDQTDFEVQLVLKRDEVPPCELGNLGVEEPGSQGVAPQLGWCTWAKTVAMGYDPKDTILRI
jgi:type VI secretion system protein ImpH